MACYQWPLLLLKLHGVVLVAVVESVVHKESDDQLGAHPWMDSWGKNCGGKLMGYALATSPMQ